MCSIKWSLQMIGLKVLSTSAVVALVLVLAPAASFAQNHGARGGGARAGGFHAGGMHAGGVAGFRGGAPGARFSGGGYRGGGYGYRGGGGFIPGAVAGAVVGGALASGAYYGYGGPGYYAQGYYDAPYDDDSVAVAPGPVGGDDSVAYCMQTYQSYDPQSGTYLGYDGLRHPCP
jgi:hypothetical protein